VRSRGKAIAVTSGFAAAAAVAGLAATPASAGIAPPPPKAPACSSDIIGRGPGDAVGRKLTFTYYLNGGQCKFGLYTLIVRNTYNPRQLAVFIKLGDGKSKEVVFNETLPWTPTGNPLDPTNPISGPGLCVTGVTTEGFRIGDIAPDPVEADCDPLRGGGARAFH
jgi:hypothetical protein